ncbi:MAG TPA: M23 family metallopeptidase [Candidatus Polarisedimenticolia bacterium]|nr:M23 family metallopeptidase [Candidatus Polarisedimenticolia bacterium]
MGVERRRSASQGALAGVFVLGLLVSPGPGDSPGPREAAATGSVPPAPVEAARSAAPVKGSPLLWPLDRAREIVSTFGEYRYDRLHAGLDLSTGGAVGLPVKAVGDGAIYRLKVEWRGYGRALYLQLKDGRRIVYGHLERYEDRSLGLEKRVTRRRQESGNRFPGDIYLEPGIPVRRGQVVAYSGESGVGPPHLHVEVRDADDHPIDPFAAGLPRPPAGAPPIFESIILTAAASSTFIEGKHREVVLDLRRKGGVFEPEQAVHVSGPFDASISAWDPTGGGRAGLTDLEVKVDGAPWYRFEPRRFGFADGPMAGLLFDHRFSRLGPSRYAYRMGLQSGNALATGGGGTLDLPTGLHDLEVRARAVGGTDSLAKMSLKVDSTPLAEGLAKNASLPDTRIGLDLLPRFIDLWIPDPGDRPGRFGPLSLSGALAGSVRWDDRNHAALTYASAAAPGDWSVAVLRALGDASIDVVTREAGLRREGNGFFVDLPAGARFATGPLVVREVEADPVAEGLVPLARAVELLPEGESLDAPGKIGFRLPAQDAPPERCGIYRLDPDSRRWGLEGDRLEAGSIVIPFRRYGRFALLRDDAPPTLGDVRPAPGRVVGSRPDLSARVSDIGKGLNWDGVRFEVDGRALVAEYDPDRGVARVVDAAPCAAGRHRLTVTAIDRAGNASPPVESEFVVRGAGATSGR